MTGWNNSLPIGLSIGNTVSEGGCTQEVDGIRYRRLPSTRGDSSHTRVRGPPKNILLPITRSSSFVLPIAGVLLFHSLRSCFSPPTTPIQNPVALIVTRGHIGGHDPPRQGQQKSHQSLHQWNIFLDPQDAQNGWASRSWRQFFLS